jgi:hypothetical protein
VERRHGQDQGEVEQEPGAPRPEGPHQKARELGLQQEDQLDGDGQRRDDLGHPVMSEHQRHENHDPDAVNGVYHHGPGTAGHGARQARGQRGEPAGQMAAPGQER